jgi:hypothetical protein
MAGLASLQLGNPLAQMLPNFLGGNNAPGFRVRKTFLDRGGSVSASSTLGSAGGSSSSNGLGAFITQS